MTAVLSPSKGGTTVASYDYSYDAADKLASTVSSVDGTSNYNYDATNQLTGASHTSQVNEAYSYDANGNRVSGGTVTGVNNQLLSDGVYNYTYDGEGNRNRRVEIGTGKVTEYVWDYRNRLASVLFKDAAGVVTKTISYTYDVNNQRIGKNVDGAVERYVIDRNQIALVFDGAGVQTHRYLYGTQIDQVLADETLALTNWFLADNQGTVKDVVDSNGTVIDHINYDSFGKVQSQSNAGYDLRFGYTGREQDGETGLNYYRARYYDNANGRFISEDPIGFEGGDSNLTRYVGNSPVERRDPSGLQEEMQYPNIPGLIWDGLVNIFKGGTSSPKPLPLPVPPLVKPVERPTPSPTPEPEQKIVPKYPNPNCPEAEQEKKDCASKYPQYTPLVNAIAPGVPFEGYKNKKLAEAIGVLAGFRKRSTYIEKYKVSPLIAQDGVLLNELKRGDPPPKYKNPDKKALHFNVFIQGVSPNKSAGSIFMFRFCRAYDEKSNKVIPPELVYRFGIDNIKDDGNNKHYN